MQGAVLCTGVSDDTLSAVRAASARAELGPVLRFDIDGNSWPDDVIADEVACVVVGPGRGDPIAAAQRASELLSKARVVLFVGHGATATLLQDIMLTPGIRLVGVVRVTAQAELSEELTRMLDKARRMWTYTQEVEALRRGMAGDGSDEAADQSA